METQVFMEAAWTHLEFCHWQNLRRLALMWNVICFPQGDGEEREKGREVGWVQTTKFKACIPI